MQEHLYGRGADRESALRTFHQGKMKMSKANGSFYPPLLKDVQKDHPAFHMDVPADLAAYTTANATSTHDFYALGDPRFNLHLGHLFWSTRYLRLHNELCDMLLGNDPALPDQKVFETARLILSHFVMKTVLSDYIGATVSPVK